MFTNLANSRATKRVTFNHQIGVRLSEPLRQQVEAEVKLERSRGERCGIGDIVRRALAQRYLTNGRPRVVNGDSK